MKRTEFWMAMAVAIAAWIAAPTYHAAAQESAGAEAGANADVQSDAGAESDAGAQADTAAQADASADTQAANQSADASAGNQTSADQQSAQSDTQAAATSDTAAGQSSTQANGNAQATNQGQADSQRSLPAPSRQDGSVQDRAATQPADQNQANQRQPADRPDATQRDVRTGASADVNADAQRSRDMRDRTRDGRDSRDRDRRGDRRDGRDRTDFRADIHFGAFTNNGLAISTVAQDSIFFHAGLREGDILISVDGHPIRSEADFHRFVVYEPGHRVPVIILRDGRRETVYIEYDQNMVDDAVVYDDQPQQPVANAGAFLGVVFDAGNPDAAVVVAVSPGSPAEQAGLQRGDIIVALNGQEVRSYRDAIGLINSMQPGDRLGIEYSRRVDDQTQAILAGKPGPGARSATLPQRELRGYRGTPQDIPPAETEIQIRRDNPNRGLLNREPRQDGTRPLLPRLRN
jgi:hypothetical protein